MKAIVAIMAILILEIIALYQGLNGIYFMSALAIISGLGGYVLVEDIRNGVYNELLDRIRRKE